jgi:DNA-binding NtrC family response regulator
MARLDCAHRRLAYGPHVGVVENVLVIDDDPDLCIALDDIARATGVRDCVSVASLPELEARAGDALRTGRAIGDVNRGHGQANGIDVFHWLRDRGYRAPIAFMTGHAANDPRLGRVLGQPNTRLLLKPFSLDALVELLRRD